MIEKAGILDSGLLRTTVGALFIGSHTVPTNHRTPLDLLPVTQEVPAGGCILMTMGFRVSRIIVTVVLLTCLICPLVEMFNNWDHTIQTGNDTEYALVVLALCVGVAYSFARFIFKSALLGFVAKSVFASCAQKSFFSVPCSLTFLLFDATSPPPLPLRI